MCRAQHFPGHSPPTAQSPPSWRAPPPRQTHASHRRAVAFTRTNPPSHDFVRPRFVNHFCHSPPGRNYHHRGTGIRACVLLTSREVQVDPLLLALSARTIRHRIAFPGTAPFSSQKGAHSTAPAGNPLSTCKGRSRSPRRTGPGSLSTPSPTPIARGHPQKQKRRPTAPPSPPIPYLKLIRSRRPHANDRRTQRRIRPPSLRRHR